MLLRLVQLYILGIVIMLLYLLLARDASFEAALKPSLLWPKTLVELIQAGDNT
jgi:hypothetical protein